MEFWLLQNKDKLQLPIPPESFDVNVGNMNETIVVENVGEINLLGKSRLATISLASFFPAQQYDFCQYTSFPNPYECIALIEKFRKLGQVRVLITESNVNQIFYIEDFTYGERDGTGDVYFTLNFKEYRKVIAKSINTSKANRALQKPRPATKKPSVGRKYTVKRGECLWNIAKRYYGNGMKYKDIARKNNIKNPNLIYPGQVLTL
ncbi:LysM peptidoglycan-binding domain-containing protein [Clostridium botulinum]|nr:LysM peptidoglycan-binding domain-containing protein [Clostridium botulinum]